MIYGVLAAVCRLLNYAAACAAAAMLVLVVAGVVMRYAFNAPLGFTEELVGLLLVAMLFLSLPLGALANRHVSVTLLTQALSPVGRRIADAMAALVTIAFAVWFIRETIPWLDLALRLTLRSEASRLLLWPWMLMLPIALGVVVLVAVMELGRTVIGRGAADGRAPRQPAPPSEP